jgi:ubiquinone/menaquinone biosynthesis C-methylase UbiE
VRRSRVDYDAIADLYDATPYRTKRVDPELLAVARRFASSGWFATLDIGCGTGNQLIADRAALPSGQLVGLDHSLGMLRQARRKAPAITWVQGDGATLPFRGESFDFVSCQFAFHHIADNAGAIREAFRVLRRRGRFVIRNFCPQESPHWLFYQYFPEARTIDLEDFCSPEAIKTEMQRAGFDAVALELEHLRIEQDLRTWFEEVRRRHTCSQLLAISDAAYEAGLNRLSQELAVRDGPILRENRLCLATIRGERPAAT